MTIFFPSTRITKGSAGVSISDFLQPELNSTIESRQTAIKEKQFILVYLHPYLTTQ